MKGGGQGEWRAVPSAALGALQPRFGASLCPAPAAWAAAASSSSSSSAGASGSGGSSGSSGSSGSGGSSGGAAGSTSGSGAGGVVLFGGVNAEHDLCDVWLLRE
jgi:hypothetical protein